MFIAIIGHLHRYLASNYSYSIDVWFNSSWLAIIAEHSLYTVSHAWLLRLRSNDQCLVRILHTKMENHFTIVSWGSLRSLKKRCIKSFLIVHSRPVALYLSSGCYFTYSSCFCNVTNQQLAKILHTRAFNQFYSDVHNIIAPIPINA